MVNQNHMHREEDIVFQRRTQNKIKQNKKRLNSFYRMILWYDSHLIWTLLVFFFQFSSENCDPSISCLEGEDILNPRTQVIPRFDQGHKLSWQFKKQSFSFWLMLSQMRSKSGSDCVKSWWEIVVLELLVVQR